MKTQEEFFQEHAVDGVLPQEKMAAMLSLAQGDTVSTTDTEGGQPDPAASSSAAPAPAPVASPAPAPAPAADPDPATTQVILAKDGVHTIGYEKLVEAREAERVAKAQAAAAEAEAERLRQELAQKSAQAPAASPAPAPKPGEDVDFGDFSDEALRKGIDATVAQRVEARVEAVKTELEAKVNEKLSVIEKQQQLEATSQHFKTIYDKHPDMDSILESRELEQWIESKPRFEQAAIKGVLEKGTAADVVELFDSFKATGKTAPPPPAPAPAPAEDPAKKAADAIAKAQAKPPTSLSEIPGATSQHDEAGAMLEMTPMALMNKFAGKSPEQIEALLNRAL